MWTLPSFHQQLSQLGTQRRERRKERQEELGEKEGRKKREEKSKIKLEGRMKRSNVCGEDWVERRRAVSPVGEERR